MKLEVVKSCGATWAHADKTTKLAATIIPVMILRGLHTDSTYQSPLRETFVKDIREDFSDLVHSSDRAI